MNSETEKPTDKASGFPFVRPIARQIIEELFRIQPQWKSSALVERVIQIHGDRGGSTESDPNHTIKRVLTDLRDEGLIVAPGHGWWRRTDVSQDENPTPHELVTASTNSTDPAIEDLEPVIKPEKVVGVGSECVYLYFNPNDRRLAELEKRDVWECKIGRTSSCDPNRRILGQGIRTALSRLPTIGLIIRTDDSAALESAIHSSLRLVGAEAPDSPGNEWFNTSPARVEKWYASFQKALDAINTLAAND